MKRRDAIKNTALFGGATLLTSALLGLQQSCQQASRLDWNPRFLGEEHARLISSFVDAILPTTDTPGGLDVKVDMFIDLVFDKMYDEEGQKKIVEELNSFNKKSLSKYQKTFDQLDAKQQKSFLQEEEANSPKFGYGVWGMGVGEQKPVGFYRSLKSLAIMGYCTSEEIGKNVLKYDPIPGEFMGCLPLSDVGGVYSL